jgi:hypothetical protein
VELKDRTKSEDEAAEDRRKNDTKEHRDAWTFYAAVGSALISALLLIVGGFGVWAALRTLDAINSQGKQADRHLSLVERPWIYPTLELDGPLTVQPTGEVIVSVNVKLKNVGKSPAMAIQHNLVLYVMHRDRNIISDRDKLCRDTAAQSAVNAKTFGELMFPGDDEKYIQRWSFGTSADDIAKYSIGGIYKDARAYDLYILFAVGYLSTVDQKAQHCSTIIYHLARVDPTNSNMTKMHRVGENVPANQLRLERWMFAPKIQ